MPLDPALARLRRSLGQVPTSNPSSTRRVKTPMEIEQEAYDAEMKRLNQQAKAQAAEQEDAAKAATKAQNDAAEARYRAEGRAFYTNASGQILPSESDEAHAAKMQHKAANDAKASEYFQSNRPFRRDMQGNVVPRHTDEEWQAQKAAKQAALDAAKVDKENKAFREQRKTEVTQVQRGMAGTTDAASNSFSMSGGNRSSVMRVTAVGARLFT